MATAGERLVALRARVRDFDEALQAERVEVVGRAFTEGKVSVSIGFVQKVAETCQEKAAECRRKVAESLKKASSDKKASAEHERAVLAHERAATKHENDRKLVEPESLELDGFKRENRGDGTVLWRGPRDWPGIPQRPPQTRLDGAQAHAAGGGGGGPSAGEPAPRQLTPQERLDAQAWDAYYEWMSDKDEWVKRQKRRAWLVGQSLLSTVLNNPKTRRVFRDSGVGRAAELLADEWPDLATDSST